MYFNIIRCSIFPSFFAFNWKVEAKSSEQLQLLFSLKSKLHVTRHTQKLLQLKLKVATLNFLLLLYEISAEGQDHRYCSSVIICIYIELQKWVYYKISA